ncbi:cysteine proteinase [Laetiporus sulphureus 93-53]|uniref:ubiquitinyl hydrolase 1 n=1 Tax=Laetiporus sulphureus 93-53 TaxID=1314785 RepID=A0A165E9M3_9APHY|nr:cysteine proteinase [Laetiporus sulphureus 93-53]KZT06536.1 cysteine proteinase [Laetiporus sulphureus 93-53]
MLSLDAVQYLCLQLFSSPVFQQLFPFVVLFLIPALSLTLSAHRASLNTVYFMVLDALSAVLPWNWFDGHPGSSSSLERRKSKKKHVRTRAEQSGQEVHKLEPLSNNGHNDGYYPGLVNISGTYCFMDSTLQAMASLCYLQPEIEEIYAKAVALDVPTPVIDALRDLLRELNTPAPSSRALRPIEIINALSTQSASKHNSLFSSREHQDAQELFQLLSECIKNEAAAVNREFHRDRGLGGFSQAGGPASREIGKSVFDGLTANRRSCVECGYTEAVMHFAFDNWQLAVPRLATQCRLEDCLDEYTRIEVLTDCICRKCSMLATCKKLEQEAERLSEARKADPEASSSKKKRVRDAQKLLARMKAALDDGRIEEDIKGVKMEKVFSRGSTKQAMIARPPRVLVLHLNRSMHYGHYATKNTCRVAFPEILDLTPYTTSGQLNLKPSDPISRPVPPIPRSTTPTPATYAIPRTLYRLAAVVCHYGDHSFGHYICYRRKPRPPSVGARRFAPPKLACLLGCECERCERYGPIRDDEDPPPRPGRGWLRISDDSVREVGLETVLLEGSGVFMLFYERVMMPRSSVYMLGSSCSSEETVRPEDVHANGSCASLPDGGGVPKLMQPIPRIIGPRIVHSVSAHSPRSLSLSPPEPGLVSSRSEPVDPQKASEKPLQNGHAPGSGHHHEPSVQINSTSPPDASSMPSDSSIATSVRLSSSPPHASSPTPTSYPSRPTSHLLPPRSMSSPADLPPSPSRTVDLRA